MCEVDAIRLNNDDKFVAWWKIVKSEDHRRQEGEYIMVFTNLRRKQYEDCITCDVGVPTQTVVEYIMNIVKCGVIWMKNDQ